MSSPQTFENPWAWCLSIGIAFWLYLWVFPTLIWTFIKQQQRHGPED